MTDKLLLTCVTDLRSLRAVIAILKKQDPSLQVLQITENGDVDGFWVRILREMESRKMCTDYTEKEVYLRSGEQKPKMNGVYLDDIYIF